MTLFTPEQVMNAQKASVDAFFGLSQKAFEGVEKLVELNMQVARTALSEAADTTRAALSAKDPQELIALQASMVQPTAERAAAYGRHVYDIATATSSEFGKVAEANVAEAQTKLMEIIDTASKNAPAGSESATALVKSAVAAANNAYEGMQRAVKQASDVAESNFQTMSASATKVANQATTKAKRAAA